MNAWALVADLLMEMNETEQQPSTQEVVITPDYQNTNMKDQTFWKYDEGRILREVEAYLSSTYKGHYVGALRQ